MQCQERDRLNDLYVSAALKNQEMLMAADSQNEMWREAIAESREAYEAALKALNSHTAQHGC